MRIEMRRTDITGLDVDAIVNAAQPGLNGGGGVDGAIHRAGGPIILQECLAIVRSIGFCATGQAVATSGGALKARHVIHTVGPIWNGGNHDEDRLLVACYQNAFDLACRLGCRSLAFPNISTGVYGFPKARAAALVRGWVRSLPEEGPVEAIIFAVFDEENGALYRRGWEGGGDGHPGQA